MVTPSSQQLADKLAQQKQAQQEGTQNQEPPNQEVTTQGGAEKVNGKLRTFQFMMAPCTVPIRCRRNSSDNGRVYCPEGIYKTSDPKEVAELEAKTKTRPPLCVDITDKEPLKGDFQRIPEKSPSQIFSEQQ